MSPKHCIIVCNGYVNKKLLKQILESSRKKIKIISADGAANTLYKFKITPDYIIGDLDSINPEVLKHYTKKKVVIKKIPEQEHTDFEKCIKFALSKKFNKIIVLGFAGKRTDHTVNNFSVLKQYYKFCDIRLIDEDFEIFYTNKKVEFKYKLKEVISLFGIPKAEGITTYGLKYPLRKENLAYGVREGISNTAAKNKVKIEIDKGELLIFKKHFGKIIL